ncbi:MAG TPA: transporter [Spongiibacteraceae bacterium]|nr:transporter [Spongiibacteraceae bacterium]
MQNKLIIYAGYSFVCLFASSLLYAQVADTGALNSEQIKQLLDEQTRKLTAERKKLADQETQLSETKKNLEEAQHQLNQLRAQAGLAPPPPVPQQPRVAQQEQPKPVGQAPEDTTTRALTVAQIFEQPGILTPRGKFMLEPSMQYGYSTSNRLSLVGYTVIPAILIGLIDVREVKRTTYIATMTARYGLTNRLELEAKLPYVYRYDESIGREVLQGSASNNVFDSSGKGIGDVELTARYQFNESGGEDPFYIGTFRVKTHTGTDPFESRTTNTIQGFRQGIETELPTGSGFYGIQPGLTMIYPSDPAVFFGSLSYLYSFERNNVKQKTDAEDVELGSIQPGGIFEFNFGLGLALNDRSSLSIGYDQSSVGKIKQDGHTLADSVTVELATLLLGFSYQFDPKRSLNLSIGAGLTVDTPDITLTMRMPISF